jgi:hypothetical protein
MISIDVDHQIRIEIENLSISYISEVNLIEIFSFIVEKTMFLHITLGSSSITKRKKK